MSLPTALFLPDTLFTFSLVFIFQSGHWLQHKIKVYEIARARNFARVYLLISL